MTNRMQKNKKNRAGLNPPKVKGRRRILIRTTLLSWSMVVFTFCIFLLSMTHYHRKQIIDEMITSAGKIFTSLARKTATSFILDDYGTVVDQCITAVKENPSLLYLVITKHNGLSLVHTRAGWFRKNLNGIWKTAEDPEKGRFIQSDLVKSKVFHVSFPFIYSGIDCGLVHIGLSTLKFHGDIKALYLRILWLTIISISMGFVASYFFARRLTRPILLLDRVTRRIGAGDLSARITIYTGDEFENLADSFNHMANDLQKSNLELQNTNKKLVATARRAGMAEVSTEILHNVGNVLNSLNITTALIEDNIHEFKLDNVTRLSDQFLEHKSDLIIFLKEKNRYKKLPAFFAELSKHICESRIFLLNKLDIMNRHIMHITEIINLQQAYNKKTDSFKPISVEELIEDAVRVKNVSLTMRGIKLNRKYNELPLVFLDRNKVLQILINLLSNAESALMPKKTKNRLIILSTKREDSEILITVSDNGIGISDEKLKKIFQYGFTTNPKGHGLGLHSGIISAKEMGGSLTAQSNGYRKGATFTLKLPLRLEAAP